MSANLCKRLAKTFFFLLLVLKNRDIFKKLCLNIFVSLHNVFQKIFSRTVTASHKRAGSNVQKTLFFTGFFVIFKSVRVHKFAYSNVLCAWLKVLSDGECLHSNSAQVIHCLQHLPF